MGGFLDRIGGLLDKGLLLAAVFPLLIVFVIVAAGAASAVGWQATFSWFGSLSATNAAVLTAFLTLLLLLLAFILRSLRRPILSVWSGAGCPSWMRDRQQRRRNRLTAEIEAPLIWADVDDIVATINHEARPMAVPAAEHRRLMRAISELAGARHAADQEDLRQRFNQLCAEIAHAYQQYNGDSLIPVRRRIVEFAAERRSHETLERNTLRSRLALEYGSADLIEGTRLGNILAALDGYPFTRYGMEGAVFWPHLEKMVEGDLLDDIQNQRILLDFELALATLLLLLTVVTLLVEPRLPLGPLPAVVLGVAALVILSRGLYLAALPTAGAMSSSLRVACDLHRRDLLSALGVHVPETLDAERAIWSRLNRLVVYGTMRGGITYRPRPADDGA